MGTQGVDNVVCVWGGVISAQEMVSHACQMVPRYMWTEKERWKCESGKACTVKCRLRPALRSSPLPLAVLLTA